MIRQFLLATFTILCIMLSSISFALTIEEAKKSGLVGEKPDGYVAAVFHRPEIDKLVTEINAKRLARYKEIAAEKGRSLDFIQEVAASRFKRDLNPGEYYMENGNWVKE